MIDKDELKDIADLVHLEINEKDEEKMMRQVSEILRFVNKLNDIEIKKIELEENRDSMENVLREDKVQKSISRKKALANALKKNKGQFVVPRIIKD